ncbi:hypothetical protein [Frankia sp. Cas4]|uniref:hypothetical protein n=1 Tax=Frankia sp. Cas4 TaxID=3073927 RepID=UPI002AD2E210|nr:hypothetical protein [Frankia sp. Cas4]
MEVRARTSGQRRRARLGVTGVSVVVAVVTVLAACGSDGGSTPDPTPSRGAVSSPAPTAGLPAPTSPADIARRDAVAAYVGMWKADAQASHTSDWQAPYLSRYASGDALQFLTRDLYADHYNGLVSKGEPINHPRVTSVSPEGKSTSVMIDDCADTRNWLQYRTDGSLLDNTPGAPHRILAEVRLHTDGLWRVTRFGIGDPGSC